MDYIKSTISSATGSNNNNTAPPAANAGAEHKSEGGGGSGFMGKLNNSMGGGAAGEAKEDYLDKTIDFVQQHVMGQGDQSNESAAEQAKDEIISDQIRGAYKGATGKEVFVADK